MNDNPVPEEELSRLYPHLFSEVTWPWGPTRARFSLLSVSPADNQVANANIVPRSGERWLVLRLVDGSCEIPGGTLEPEESPIEAIRRELREEAGAVLISHRLVGGWRCHSLADRPYRPHLPHPEFYRLVFTGEVSLAGSPSNPPGAEQVKSVEAATLDEIYERFSQQGRFDLTELYRLAERISRR